MIALLIALQVTNCQWTATGWTCDRDKTLDYGRILQSGRDLVPEYRGPTPEQQRQAQGEYRRQRAGRLIGEGKCPAAEALALKEGDLELAEQVKSYCARD